MEGSPEYSGVQSSAIWKRKLRSVLDKSVATLKALFKNSTGLFLELEGVSLWEGLACLYSSKQWVVMEEVCQMFYEVKKLGKEGVMVRFPCLCVLRFV